MRYQARWTAVAGKTKEKWVRRLDLGACTSAIISSDMPLNIATSNRIAETGLVVDLVLLGLFGRTILVLELFCWGISHGSLFYLEGGCT